MSKRRPWNRTSASQQRAFHSCRRYWFLGWIERVPRETSPAMQRGKDIHTEAEHYLKTGEFRDSCYTELELNYRPYVEQLALHLPPPMDDELIIEQRINLSITPEVGWLGFIDVGYSGNDANALRRMQVKGRALVIRDIKTTSDFRYCSTPKELLDDIQLMSYAEWAFQQGHKGTIDVGLVYIKTEKKVVRKKPMVKLVRNVVDFQHSWDVWEREKDIVREMQDAALVENVHDLPPNITACSKYGGCPFRDKCGLDATTTISEMFRQTKKEKIGMGFLSKLNKDAKKTKKTSKKPKAGQILSEDAPSRTTEDTETETEFEKEPEKKKTRKKKAAKKTNGMNDIKSFALYVDCYPTKDINGGGIEPTRFEDWFNPLQEKLNESALEEHQIDDYRFLSFSLKEAGVAKVVKDAVEKGLLPSRMIIRGGDPGAKFALPCLIPYATHVVDRFGIG